MKKQLFLVILFLVLLLQAFSQEEIAKSGWNFGALPSVSFDSDLGFQYGALVDLYNYGDGSNYPQYNHHFYFEVSRFTKGSGINRFYYDSDQLINGLRTFVDISYLSDLAYDFYGFNGYDAVVNKDWINEDREDYITRMFYKYDRKLFRFKVDLLGNLSGNNLRWVAGLHFLNFQTGPVNLEKLNKGKDDDELLRDVPGLYQKYLEWNIISQDESNGGFVPAIKAGLVYDTRDNRPNPMNGIWTEAVIEGPPGFFGAETSFAKLSLTHRQYFTIIPRDLSLAYRLNYQTTITGHVPFYYQTQVITSELKTVTSEGLGGFTTLRGIWRNRVVGDGYFLGNIEARWKFARFNLINNNFYLGLNGFFDFGKVTKKIEANPNNIENPMNYFRNGAESMRYSYGAGLRIAMNQNFIIRVDYGIAVDDRDGDTGIYIGLNYLF